MYTGGSESVNSKKSHQITTFLDSNPEFLENYVMSNVDLETLERWTIRRARRINQMDHLEGQRATQTMY
jgi:hypothetical protein